MECVATEMGWISRAEAQSRVLLSLRALAGELPGFTLARQKKHGWIPTFFNASTGAFFQTHGSIFFTLTFTYQSNTVFLAACRL